MVLVVKATVSSELQFQPRKKGVILVAPPFDLRDDFKVFVSNIIDHSCKIL
jgi:23S rRNA A2030 N6-methylase RlmJ